MQESTSHSPDLNKRQTHCRHHDITPPLMVEIGINYKNKQKQNKTFTVEYISEKSKQPVGEWSFSSQQSKITTVLGTKILKVQGRKYWWNGYGNLICKHQDTDEINVSTRSKWENRSPSSFDNQDTQTEIVMAPNCHKSIISDKEQQIHNSATKGSSC